MKIQNKLYWMLAAAPALLTSCADYLDTNEFVVEKPQTLAQYEYLNDYAPLKEYIDRSAHPGFLLGSGVTASEYNKQQGVYLLSNSNFDMLTAGNAMKYASCVKDDGSMDFGTVSDFVSNVTNSGLQVYGHTLCWHSQQNVKWLNSLIADKEISGDGVQEISLISGGDAESGPSDSFIARFNGDNKAEVVEDALGTGKVFVNPIGANPAQEWDSQFFIVSNTPLQAGDEVRVKFRYRCDDTRNIGTQAHGAPGAYHHWAFIGTLNATPEWKEHEWTGVISADQAGSDGCSSIAFNLASAPEASNFYIDDVEFVVIKAMAAKINYPLVSGGTADGGPSSSFIARTNGDNPAEVVDDPKGTGKVFINPIVANPSQSWDSQFFIVSDTPLMAGDNVNVKFRFRCDDTRNIETQAHGAPGAYHHWAFIGTLNATPEWKDYEWSGTISESHAGSDGCLSIAFNLASAPEASNFYIDDIEFNIEKSGNSIPLSKEEKCEVLTAEMERWVKGMMDATEAKVKAWDVVNEAISGGPWGQKYDLQHGGADTPNDFFWQDYLGDDFVRVPVKYARQYFAENGGNPDDLKLFINDYNLESDWDDNQKLKSLIQWINQWESDGETKIDGIGTQMHVSYFMNPNTQKSKEEHVVKMFELMAATGKLCRITELDMGICDADGNSIKTADVTFEQEQKMAEYYKFIIEKYFEIIPQAQQFGICQWAQTDSPEGSGWRGGEPIGLWNGDYQRKPTYGGFADGLQGK